MMDDEEADLREQIFHNNVREQIVSVTHILRCHFMNTGTQFIHML